MSLVQLQSLSQTPIAFFVSLFLGIHAQTFRASVIDLTHEPVPAGEAFHLFPTAPADLILAISAQEEIGTDFAVDSFTNTDEIFSSIDSQRLRSAWGSYRIRGTTPVLLAIVLKKKTMLFLFLLARKEHRAFQIKN